MPPRVDRARAFIDRELRDDNGQPNPTLLIKTSYGMEDLEPGEARELAAELLAGADELDPGNVDAFRRQLLAIWERAHDISVQQVEGFHEFSGHTKDLLLALGLEWDSARDVYTFRPGPFGGSR